MRATDFLSALFLCLAAILAGAHAPLTGAAPSVASPPASGTGNVDARDQQSSPTNPKRPFIAAEWRIGKAALVQGEGKSKVALLPTGPSLPDLASGREHGASVHRVELSALFRGYGARAPPVSS